jgi:hypothetical protein
MAKEAETDGITTTLQNYGAAVVTLMLGAEASQAVDAGAQYSGAVDKTE